MPDLTDVQMATAEAAATATAEEAAAAAKAAAQPEWPFSKADDAGSKPDDTDDGADDDTGDAKTVEWDKERQKRDQAHAAEIKSLTGKLEAMEAQVAAKDTASAGLAEQLKALEAKLTDLGTGAADDEAELDQYAETADVVKAVNALKKRVKAAEAEAVKAKKDVAEAKKEAADARKSAQDAGNRAEGRLVETALKELDEKYGAEHRNAALAKAADMLVEWGFTDDNIPTLAAKKRALDLAYNELAGGEKKAKAKPKTKGDADVAVDDGKGGAAAAAAPVTGSLKDVMADKKKKGHFKNLTA